MLKEKSLKRTIVFNTLFFLIAMLVLAGVGIYFFNWSRSSERKSQNAQLVREKISEEEFEKTDCEGMSLEQAKKIASQSECRDQFTGNFLCNEITNTWWLDLNLEKEGCNPACVVNTQTGLAEINWRCTGLLQRD